METLITELGRKRGAEEVLRQINPVYKALIAELHRYQGSVIGFAGDAITCWLGDSSGQAAARATACALAMQACIQPFKRIQTSMGTTIPLGIKVAIAGGPVRRLLIGNPAIRVLDVIAGNTLTRMAKAEKQANAGEVIVSEEIIPYIQDIVEISKWRPVQETSETLRSFAVVNGLLQPIKPNPWPKLNISRLNTQQLKPWLLPNVYHRIQAGDQFLGDFRLATPLFIKFSGIDYEQDVNAGQKLDAYVRWVQSILQRYEGTLVQLIIGDKGTYIYANFGTPLTHEDDTQRALLAALTLQKTPHKLRYIGPVQMGIHQGQVWTVLVAVLHDMTTLQWETQLM